LLDDDDDADDQDSEFDEKEFDTCDVSDDDDQKVESAKNKQGKMHVPPCFFTRDAFCALESEGLAVMPDSISLKLSHHSSSQQWHARCTIRKLNFAPKWGEKRSETLALLLALKQLWSWYLAEPGCEKDTATTQIASINKKIQAVKPQN